MTRKGKEGLPVARREQVLAFRLHNHNLTRRQSVGSLVEAARVCGIRNSPPGSAELAFHARLAGFALPQLETALSADKTLLEAWTLRSSPFFFPTTDRASFFFGTLPSDDAALEFCVPVMLPLLEAAEISATKALELVASAMLQILAGVRLTKGELSTAVSQRVPEKLLYWCKGCQANHVPESFFRLATQKAQLCFAPRAGAETSLRFIRSDEWLGTPLLQSDAAQPAAEILRRYLHCYGPSTPKHFAKWAGISANQARQTWQTIEDEGELSEVSFEDNPAWLLKQDQKIFDAPPDPAGVRLLPPYDPYLLLNDRETLLPDKTLHSEVWRALGNPGIVLAEGEAAGMWRPQKKGKRLLLNIELFRPLSAKTRAEVEIETELLAPFKGCTATEVHYNA